MSHRRQLQWLLLLEFLAEASAAFCDQQSSTEPCTCSDLRLKFERPLSDHWQKLTGAPVEVFSSYLDERQWTLPTSVRLSNNTTTVRTIAHGLQKEHAVNHIVPIFCYVYDGDEWTHMGRAEYVRVYISSLHAEEYTAHFLLCFVPQPTRSIVAVGFGTEFCQIDVAVNIFQQTLPEPPSDRIVLNVCVSPFHGIVESLQVAEFIEMYRLLGAEHFTFYNYKIAPNLRRLLDYYSKKNMVSIVPWYSLDNRLSYFYFDQRSALNDCMYRNIASATHIAVVDLDEVLVPRVHSGMSLTALLDQLQSSSQHPSLIGSYCFEHVYFEQNMSDPTVSLETGNENNPQLVTQTRFSRTIESYPKGTIRSKCIHNPQLTVAIDIHSAQWHVNKSIAQVVLPEDQALLHHYRTGRMETFRKHPERFIFENDYFLRSYNSELSANVKAALSLSRPIDHQSQRNTEL